MWDNKVSEKYSETIGDFMRRYEKEISNLKREISQILISSLNPKKTNETDTLYKMLDELFYAMNESKNITITNCDGTILYVNDNFCQLSKYEKEEIVGQNYRIVNAGVHPKAFFIQMWETLMSGDIWYGEIQHKAKDGSTFWVFTTIVPFIDDFGTGYSSFNYLKTFKIDGVKIDRSFIQNISSKSENASITSAMIKMAQHLKLEVIAEGVETKEELEYLLGENCRYIQGFYFGKPCPIVEFEKTYSPLFQEH